MLIQIANLDKLLAIRPEREEMGFLSKMRTENQTHDIDWGFSIKDVREKVFTQEQLPTWGWVIAFILIFITYLYQSTIPAFNADDVYQIQQKDFGLLSNGQWGTYFLFTWLLENNPTPVISTLIGSAILLYSSIISSTLIGFRLALSQFFFLTISTISIFYGSLFGFEISHIAYPIAGLLSISGIALFLRKNYIVGLILISLSPQFYFSGLGLALAVVTAVSIKQLMKEEGYQGIITFFKGVLAIAAGIVLYEAQCQILPYIAAGYVPVEENISPTPLFVQGQNFLDVFVTYSFTIFSNLKRYEVGEVWIGYYASIVFIIFLLWNIFSSLRERRIIKTVLLVALNLFLLVTPYCLSSLQHENNTDIQFRSLYAFSMIHAFWLASLVDRTTLLSKSGIIRTGILTLVIGSATTLILSSAIAVNQWAFDNYLASQSDILATSRIIVRIDNMLATNGETIKHNLPIAVIVGKSFQAGPRGYVETSRYAPRSREWLFRLIDPRFIPVSFNKNRVPDGEVIYQRALEVSKTHGQWPAKDSVFMMDGVIIVVISHP